MDDFNVICAICRKTLVSDLPVVTVQRGLTKIIESSLERGDGLNIKLEGKTSICVHVICRQNYTRPTTIKASTASGKPSTSADSTLLPTLRSTECKFYFKTCCFLCGKDAIRQTKLSSERRRSVHNVSTLETKQSILTQCGVRKDDWAESVKARILNVNDLIAPEAIYHGDCYKAFF